MLSENVITWTFGYSIGHFIVLEGRGHLIDTGGHRKDLLYGFVYGIHGMNVINITAILGLD